MQRVSPRWSMRRLFFSSTFGGTSMVAVRGITTGENYSYKPGPITRGLRRVFTALTPRDMRKRLAVRMQRGMEKTEDLERQQQWLKQHGSPLQVMGLPDHAELTEVRARYRSLVLDTHPDTATAASTPDRDEYTILQNAYAIATNPSSLWHRNGSSPELYRQLLVAAKQRPRAIGSVTWFAIFSYVVMGVIGFVFAAVLVRQGLELALQFFDPEFYKFMIAQEKEEQRKRLAGEYVNTDPKRLAPTAVKRLLFPGRFIHGEDPTADEDGPPAETASGK